MKRRSNSKKIIITILAILVASILAILSKALIPSEVNVEEFDSIFVNLLGFPVVASIYFIMIYTQGALTTQLFGKKSRLSNTQIGLRFGISFGLIFLLGMQEVVVSASPFSTWGLYYVVYQFFMGFGEAVAALIMCILLAKFTIDEPKSNYLKENKTHNKGLIIGLIALTFTIERIIAYKTGIINSDIMTSPIPTFVWTIIFGIALGVSYVLLLPIFNIEKNPVRKSFKLVVLTLGLSWIIFNSFIGLIMNGVMVQVLTRSGLDIIVLFSTSLIIMLKNKTS